MRLLDRKPGSLLISWRSTNLQAIKTVNYAEVVIFVCFQKRLANLASFYKPHSNANGLNFPEKILNLFIHFFVFDFLQ